MGKLYIIGLGIYPTYITYEGIEVLKKVDVAFLENYTSPIPNWTIEFLKNLSGKNIRILTREDIENRNAEPLIKELDSGKNVAFIVPGDPFIATTHNYIRILAKLKGHEVKIIHGVSIISAAISLCGLSPYKFGPVATITYPRQGIYSNRPYEITMDNLSRGLHTLLLLDISDTGNYMTISEAIEILEKLEELNEGNVFTKDRVLIGIARVGYPDCKIHVDYLENLKGYNFGEPPHVIIVPAKLHFIEFDVLTKYYNVPEELLKKLVDKI